MPSHRRPIRPASPVGPVGPPEESLGPLLAQLRAERGLSQLRLAERLCAAAAVPTVSRHEVSRWEREERVPGPFWLGWLAAVLEVPAHRLVAARLVTARRGRGRAAATVGAPAGTGRAARARRAASG
jgi:transcriptional regulator with XRE-family HTH domain